MNPLSCSQCGAVNASNARVCYQCKKILSIGAHSICGSCYHRNPVHLANCVNCGMELVETKELEKESALAFENIVDEGTGPLTFPSNNEAPLNNLDGEDDSDPSFYEAKTKKHEIPEFANTSPDVPEAEVTEESPSGNEATATHTDIMDNEKEASEMAEHENDQPIVGNSTPDEDVDILSMLDLDLTEEKFASEPPRQISEDQIQPTDWINELVPSTDELPTMADMLPEPTAPNAPEELDGVAMPSSVMDLLFGDSDSAESSADDKTTPEPPTVPNMEIRAQEEIEIAENNAVSQAKVDTAPLTASPAEPIEPVMADSPVDSSIEQAALAADPSAELDNADGWLSDALTDIDVDDSGNDLFEQPELNQEELPDWMDFDSDQEIQAESSPAEQSADNEDQPLAFLDTEEDEDALDWLTDDSATKNVSQVELPEQISDVAQEMPSASQNGTRDLSASAFLEQANELSDDPAGLEDGGAVQANLPNWIKQMAPDSEQESLGIAPEIEPDNSQMDDDALSAILEDIGDDSNSSVASADIQPPAALESELAIELPEPVEEMEIPSAAVEQIDEPEFSPMFSEDSAIISNEIADAEDEILDFVPVDEPDDEDLIRDAITAIESEIQEIKETTPAQTDLVVEADMPEPTSTKDLPDWLQSPQTSPLNPEDLGFIEAKIEEAKAISADQITENTAEEIDSIIAENVAEEPEVPSIISEITQAPADASDQLAQFDWGDVESVFDGPADTPPADTPVDLEVPSIEMPEAPEITEELEDPVEAAAFDWLQDSAPPSFDEPQEINTADFADLNLEPLENISIGTPHDHDVENTLPQVEAELPSSLSEVDSAFGIDAELPAQPDLPKIEDILGTEEIIPEMNADFSIDAEAPALESSMEELSTDLLGQEANQGLQGLIEDEASAIDQTNEFKSFAGLNGVGTDELTTDPLQPDSFEPLKEFQDESDVFATVRDQPPVENSFSPESLTPFETGPISIPDQEQANNFSLDSENQSADDFFSALAEENSSTEMPSWASELTETPQAPEADLNQPVSDSNPLAGIDDVVGIAPSISNQVSEIQNLHAPQMMEPIAHRKRARMAAQAAGTVPMTDPTQPVVVPKERQKYQPRFNATQFDGRPSVDKKKRNRQVGFLVVAGVLTLAVLIAVSVPFVIRLFN